MKRHLEEFAALEVYLDEVLECGCVWEGVGRCIDVLRFKTA
jgi:hypothetical protein